MSSGNVSQVLIIWRCKYIHTRTSTHTQTIISCTYIMAGGFIGAGGLAPCFGTLFHKETRKHFCIYFFPKNGTRNG